MMKQLRRMGEVYLLFLVSQFNHSSTQLVSNRDRCPSLRIVAVLAVLLSVVPGIAERSLQAQTIPVLPSLNPEVGVESDGVESDGVESDGVESDGVESDGVESDGVESDGVESDGVELEAEDQDGALDESVVEAEDVEFDSPNTDLPDTNLSDTDLPDTNLPDADLPDTDLLDTELPNPVLPDTNDGDSNRPSVELQLPSSEPSGSQAATLKPRGAIAIFEDVTLTPNIMANPTTIRGISGGPLAASQVAGRTDTATGICTGFVDAKPDHRIELTEFFDYLRLQVESPEDTVLVVRGPGGSWCNDDGVGFNPSLEGEWFSGIYDVWVGSYNEQTYHPYVIRLSDTQ